jgi:hypothetical protein
MLLLLLECSGEGNAKGNREQWGSQPMLVCDVWMSSSQRTSSLRTVKCSGSLGSPQERNISLHKDVCWAQRAPEDPWLVPSPFTALSPKPLWPAELTLSPEGSLREVLGVKLLAGSSSSPGFHRALHPPGSHLCCDCEVTRWWELVSSLPSHPQDS